MSRAQRALAKSAFLILLAISDRPRHGLGIADTVEELTSGGVKLGPGTLYQTLQKLQTRGLIQQTTTPPDPSDDDPRRRYYRLTDAGERAVQAEVQQWKQVLEAPGAQGLLGDK